MKTVILILGLFIMPFVSRSEPIQEGLNLSTYFGAHSGAFVLFDAAKCKWFRYHPELCRERVTPCSTFKIPNSLIALETGVADGPDFSLPWDGVERPIKPWNKDQTLRSAYAVSCVWFYQELARRIGQKSMDDWLAAFCYGNCDTSGGLTKFWIESSLKISPDEQVEFLHRLQTRQLPVSAHALDALLDIMVVKRDGEITYRGKTGTAGNLVTGVAVRGWWVGSVATPNGDYFFATCITGGENPSGREAHRITDAILAALNILPARNEPAWGGVP